MTGFIGMMGLSSLLLSIGASLQASPTMDSETINKNVSVDIKGFRVYAVKAVTPEELREKKDDAYLRDASKSTHDLQDGKPFELKGDKARWRFERRGNDWLVSVSHSQGSIKKRMQSSIQILHSSYCGLMESIGALLDGGCEKSIPVVYKSLNSVIVSGYPERLLARPRVIEVDANGVVREHLDLIDGFADLSEVGGGLFVGANGSAVFYDGVKKLNLGFDGPYARTREYRPGSWGVQKTQPARRILIVAGSPIGAIAEVYYGGRIRHLNAPLARMRAGTEFFADSLCGRIFALTSSGLLQEDRDEWRMVVRPINGYHFERYHIESLIDSKTISFLVSIGHEKQLLAVESELKSNTSCT